MDLELTDIESIWQRQVEGFCAATRGSSFPSGPSLLAMNDLYARAAGAGICGLSCEGAHVFETEGIALFLALEQLAKQEPELAFAIAYRHICSSVASVLLEKGPCRQATRHINHPHFPFNNLLVWPHRKQGVITGTVCHMNAQSKQLKFEDPLMPLHGADNPFFLGWAYTDPEHAVAFWIPAGHGHKLTDQPVRCLGLNGISFR
ncbi:MAG TPA: hypothetical protein VFR08_02985, partial [Candidatus Angelobacter sp.]|nr:hypothetical protein [Candidatus Angelobacter sp.]